MGLFIIKNKVSLIHLFLILISIETIGQKNINAFRLEDKIVIDGIFEPEKWIDADSSINFIQMEPSPGDPASEKTITYFGFDDKNIYVAFKCYQTVPINAKNQSRDALSKNDDIIVVILDTYNDNRSGYMFFTNPLGTQYDVKVNDDGRNLDMNWDTEWVCESQTFDWGWSAEFKIPYKSLKYKKGLSNWGINFGRVIPATFETVYWSGTLSDDFRISQGGKLNGIDTHGKGMKITAFPYLSVFNKTDNKLGLDGGGDIQWQLTPNVSVNSTINPDFATVEADQQKINLTRYELSYPEKRLFFQEGNDMYNTRIKTFYSRRIQDIDFGSRTTGKIGKIQFNILNVITPERDKTPSTFFTAARFKYDFLKSSTLGMTMVDKSWKDGFTRSLSLDYVVNLGKTWKLTGQFVGSAPGNFWEHSAFFLRFARENNIYHYHIRYSEIGENFRENVNQTGFIIDEDRRVADSDISYKWWLKNNTFEFISIESRNNIFWSRKGKLRSWYVTESVEFYLKNKFSFDYAYNNEYKLYEKDFYNHKHTFSLGYNTQEWSHAMVSYTTGKNFDLNLNLITGSFRIKPVENFSVTYSANYLNLKSGNTNDKTFINIVTANYNFTKDLWIKLFAQNNSADKNIYLYGLFGWRFKPPFGALYLIYSMDRYKTEEQNSEISNNIFLKLTYPVSILK